MLFPSTTSPTTSFKTSRCSDDPPQIYFKSEQQASCSVSPSPTTHMHTSQSQQNRTQINSKLVTWNPALGVCQGKTIHHPLIQQSMVCGHKKLFIQSSGNRVHRLSPLPEPTPQSACRGHRTAWGSKAHTLSPSTVVLLFPFHFLISTYTVNGTQWLLFLSDALHKCTLHRVRNFAPVLVTADPTVHRTTARRWQVP